MAMQKTKLNSKIFAEIKDFSWSGNVEISVNNPSKGISMLISYRSNFDGHTKKQIRFFQVQVRASTKKRSSTKKVNITWNKYLEFYDKLSSIKIINIAPSVDYALVGINTRLEIERGNSKISFKWIYGTQSKTWKKLDDLVLLVLGICGEKRILIKDNSNSKTYPIGL